MRLRTRLTIAGVVSLSAASALAQPVSKDAAASAPTGAPTVVVVVRHAEKGTEPAADPPLTAAPRSPTRT
jgi:hypothetical protein